MVFVESHIPTTISCIYIYIYINAYYIILYPHSKSLYPPKKLYYHIWALVIWGFSMVFRSHGGTQSSKSSTSMDFPWIFHELNHPSPRLVVTGSRDVPGSHRSSHLRQARTTHLQGIQLGCILAALEGLS